MIISFNLVSTIVKVLRFGEFAYDNIITFLGFAENRNCKCYKSVRLKAEWGVVGFKYMKGAPS
jgi:hypothetical protein